MGRYLRYELYKSGNIISLCTESITKHTSENTEFLWILTTKLSWRMQYLRGHYFIYAAVQSSLYDIHVFQVKLQ